MARRRLLAAVGTSVLLGGLATRVLPLILAHPRPFVVLHLVPLLPHAAESSFPSDHTMLGAASAAPLVWRRWRVGLPLLVLTLLVGAARVAAALHWPSDIVGTTLVALVLGWCAIPLTEVVLARFPGPLLARVGIVTGRSSPVSHPV
jgi:undecaprenyl-diphosphatase